MQKIKIIFIIIFNGINYYWIYLHYINFNNIYNNTKAIYKKELIPAWLEGLGAFLGAIFAFIGLIVAWRSLNKDLSEQNKKIENLVTLTETMAGQADYLNKSVEVQNKILNEMISQGDHTKRMNELLIEQGNLESEQKKLQVKPDFKIADYGNNTAIWTCQIKNVGKDNAENINVSFSMYNLEDVEFKPPNFNYELLQPNHSISFQIEHVSRGKRSINGEVGMAKIVFTDIYENKYENNFKITFHNMRFTFEKLD
jgi:hypothetical protein